jgi:adenosine/AMP kinase
MDAESFEFRKVRIQKPDDVNVIIGQSHFIRTAEDLAEAVVVSLPGARFGLAFSEASGDCLVRVEGNDPVLETLAAETALKLGAGHSFLLFLREGYPISVLNAIKCIPEVCSIYCATANSVEVILAESSLGRGILGVIDGESPRGVEEPEDISQRRAFLRKLGYKRG